MENQESPVEPKLIFGLSPKATLINAFIMAFLSQLAWAIKFCEQIPSGIDYSKLDVEKMKLVDDVPWYYTIPFAVLAVLLASVWTDYKLSGATNSRERAELSSHLYWKKMLYVVGGLVIFSPIAKFISLFIVLYFK